MADCTYRMTEHNGADTPARYYVNGIRVSAERFRDLKERAYSSGRLDSFATKGRQLRGGRIRRTNYCVATFSYPVSES